MKEKIQQVFELLMASGYGAEIEFRETGIRFGYWHRITTELLEKICSVLPVEEESDFDDETGWQYFYKYAN